MKKSYFSPADVLLPKNDFENWSVIACDQYTSEPAYWDQTKIAAGNKPSALNIILPEILLSDDNSAQILKINQTMQDYLDTGVFEAYENALIFTERTLKNGKVRKGLVGLIDLEDYSYLKGADTLIRATEETVLERIPPRVNIRRDAPIELPHVMLLIDDAENNVIKPISEKADSYKKLYDFDLMQGAGHIKGYAVASEDVAALQAELEKLLSKSEDGLLFVVGDGNHSLASAKECYNQGKASRYALVELVNIHDESLEFEPIYRVLFGVEPMTVINDFIAALGGEYEGTDAQKFNCVFGETSKTISLKPTGKLSVATLQKFLDDYIQKNPQIKIDYIHGKNSVYELCKKKKTLGFIFEGMDKSELFEAVCEDGSLPRKTFSMGCADDKRFYLEARKIK